VRDTAIQDGALAGEVDEFGVAAGVQDRLAPLRDLAEGGLEVAVGDEVIEDQDFVEVMTDKATVTITMPCDGVIKDLKFAEGDVVPVETVIAVIDQVGEASSGHEAKTAVAAASA